MSFRIWVLNVVQMLFIVEDGVVMASFHSVALLEAPTSAVCYMSTTFFPVQPGAHRKWWVTSGIQTFQVYIQKKWERIF
jgi:hypothetical protein